MILIQTRDLAAHLAMRGMDDRKGARHSQTGLRLQFSKCAARDGAPAGSHASPDDPERG